MSDPETPEAPEPAPEKPAKASRAKPAAKPEPTEPEKPESVKINENVTDQGTSTAGREVDPDDPGINANVTF